MASATWTAVAPPRIGETVVAHSMRTHTTKSTAVILPTTFTTIDNGRSYKAASNGSDRTQENASEKDTRDDTSHDIFLVLFIMSSHIWKIIRNAVVVDDSGATRRIGD